MVLIVCGCIRLETSRSRLTYKLRFTQEEIAIKDESGKDVQRNKLEVSLAIKLGIALKRPRKQKSFNEKVKMNLHRLNQLLFYVFFRWDGGKWGGSCIREEIIQLAKEKYGSELSDEAAIRQASEQSTYFAGLWCFFDMELRLCVEPFMDWERGDITAFLSLFPAMCMYVASSHKTKVPKVYKNKHPNVIRLFAANCIQLDEEKIEFMNAKIGRWMKARIKDLNISHYIRVTSIMKCIQNITQSFSRLFNRKEQENENERLRTMYTKPRWDATNAELRVWILEQFAKSLSGEFDNLLWPREDPFELGLIRILNKYAPELRTWIEQQRRLGAYC